MNTPILDRTIVCPKCQTKTMRKAHGYSVGKEYFDDRCHEYFGISELVKKWGYDLGDFGDLNSWERLEFTKTFNPIWEWWYGTTPFWDENYKLWENKAERDNAYEMVNRMFLDIPELEEDEKIRGTYTFFKSTFDLDGTTNDGIDTGLYR